MLAGSQPNDGFEWVQGAAGPTLVCGALRPLTHHAFTTRAWRLGSDPARTGSDPARTDDGWREVAAAFDVDLMNLARMHQVHGAAVVTATRGAGATRPEADIAITADVDVALAVQAADCVPLLIADPRQHVVAAVHAGWRGLAALAPQVAVEALSRQCGSRPADLIAAIGPSIGACCYEVGADVRDALMRAGFPDSTMRRWFFDAPQPTAENPSMPTLTSNRRTGRWFLDCWAVAHDQLERAGVERIHVARLCTASHPDVLCSYRRDGKGAGRIAGVIRLRETQS